MEEDETQSVWIFFLTSWLQKFKSNVKNAEIALKIVKLSTVLFTTHIFLHIIVIYCNLIM